MPALQGGPAGGHSNEGFDSGLEQACRIAAPSPPAHRRAGRGTLAALAGGGGGEDADTPPASPRISLACADDDAQGQTLEVYWDFENRPPHPRAGGVERHRRPGLRPAPPFQCVPSHPSLELRHRHRPEPLPGAVSRRHQDRRLPDGAAPEGAPNAPGQPLHRRRHRSRQDHRGRTHRPRAAASQEGEDHRRRPRPRPYWSNGRPRWRSASASSS